MAGRPFLLLAALGGALAAACGGEERSGKALLEDAAQALRNEAAIRKAPEDKREEIESGATAWRSSFSETSIRTEKDFTTRSFQVRIRNRASSPQRFRGVIRYFDGDGQELRSLPIVPVMVEPYSTQEVNGKLVVPERINALIRQVVPEIEPLPWDDEGSAGPSGS